MRTDPAIIEFLCWNAAVGSAYDRLILLAVGRWRRLWDTVSPSIDFIASETGVSRSTAKRSLARLQEQGYIIITNRYDAKGQATNEYDVDAVALGGAVPAERRQILARLGGEVPTDPHPGSQGTPPPVHTDPHKKKREKQKSESTCAIDQHVSEIYEAYPRKVARRRAERAIREAILRSAEIRQMVANEAALYILTKTRTFAKSDAGNAGQFTPHPATWFNQDRFNDDPKEWIRNDQANQPAPSQWTEDGNHISGITIRE